jgi:Icc-related predicted phosphoesterase
LNKLKYGRYLDILVTHAAPRGIHDAEDWTHIGIKAFNWLIKVCQA